MTARREKLLWRLDLLEREYAKLAARELERVAAGKVSTYLMRKTPHLVDGKFYRDATIAQIESFEKEIIFLKRKLGEPLQLGPVAVVSQFYEKRTAEKDWYDGGSVREAKKALEQLRNMQNSENKPSRQ